MILGIHNKVAQNLSSPRNVRPPNPKPNINHKTGPVFLKPRGTFL